MERRQTGLQGAQVDSDVLTEQVDVTLSQICHEAATEQLLQNAHASNYRQAGLLGESPTASFVHKNQIDSEFPGELNRARFARPKTRC